MNLKMYKNCGMPPHSLSFSRILTGPFSTNNNIALQFTPFKILEKENQKASNNKYIKATNLQTTQPPISISGAFTTRVNLMTIGLEILDDSPAAAFLPESDLSLQFGQCQSCWGTHGKSKQAATPTKQAKEDTDTH